MPVLIEGVQLQLGGRTFTAPPLPLKTFRTHPEWMQVVTSITAVPTPEQEQAIVGLVHASLLRNYPEITPEEVEDLLDLGNMIQVLHAVMNVSGVKARALGEAQGPESL